MYIEGTVFLGDSMCPHHAKERERGEMMEEDEGVDHLSSKHNQIQSDIISHITTTLISVFKGSLLSTLSMS